MSTSHPPLPPVFGLIDVGTAKIVCLLLARRSDGSYGVAGLGHQKSRGLKASVIVEADAAEEALRATIAQAEQMAGATLADVFLAAACGRMTSTHVAAGLDLDGRAVTSVDIERLLAAGATHATQDDRTAVHVNALGARLDGVLAPGHALGRPGRQVALDVHTVAADRGPLRHLLHVAERCQLRVLGLAPAPLASALAVTTADERQRGVLVIDLGAGSTSFALFVFGNLVATHVIPIGSNHLTYDLARTFGTTVAEAERIKRICAIVDPAQPMPDDTVAYQPRGDDHAETLHGTRAQISSIFTSRLDALLQQIHLRMEQLALASHVGGDVLLTGGGSQLAGLAAHVAMIFGCPARVAAPLPLSALPSALLQPAFATVAGLESIARDRRLGMRFDPVAAPAMSMAGHAGGWSRPSF